MEIGLITLAAVVLLLALLLLHWFVKLRRTQALLDTETRNNEVLCLEKDRLTKNYLRTQEELKQANGKVETLIGEEARTSSENKHLQARIEEIKHERERFETHNASLISERDTLKQAKEEAQRDLALQRTEYGTRLKALKEQEEVIKETFKNTADRLFEAKSKGLSEVNQTSVTRLLEPFREQLGEFRHRLEERFTTGEKERHTLANELEKLRALNTQLNAEAGNLTKALKGDNKLLGNWGELKLEKLLEGAGLQKGVEYELQATYESPRGEKLRPDAVIHLPDEKHVIVDAKMSLDAHHQYYSAGTDEARDRALAAHLKSIENHVANLSDKGYFQLKGLKTVDFVLMFIPIEAAFMLALHGGRYEKVHSILDRAMQKRVMIVGPSNLMIALKTIAYIWKLDHQERQTAEIAKLGASLHDKFCVITDKLTTVRQALEKTTNAFDDLESGFTQGRGNLISRAKKFKNMGLITKKEVNKGLLSRVILGPETTS